MIKDIVVCSPEERHWLSVYLKNSNALNFARRILEGNVSVHKGFIRSLYDLSSLHSAFGKQDWGMDEPGKFLISEVYPLMVSPSCPDVSFLAKVQEYMGKIKSNQMEFVITILKRGRHLMVVDGNKRTIAYFEIIKQVENKIINYPVFLLQRGS